MTVKKLAEALAELERLRGEVEDGDARESLYQRTRLLAHGAKLDQERAEKAEAEREWEHDGRKKAEAERDEWRAKCDLMTQGLAGADAMSDASDLIIKALKKKNEELLKIINDKETQ